MDVGDFAALWEDIAGEYGDSSLVRFYPASPDGEPVTAIRTTE